MLGAASSSSLSETERKRQGSEMECLLGLLKVRVVRGVNLAICDPLTHSSDPYVVLRLGQQVIIKLLRRSIYLLQSSIAYI